VELSVMDNEGAKAMAEVAIIAETAAAKDFMVIFQFLLCYARNADAQKHFSLHSKQEDCLDGVTINASVEVNMRYLSKHLTRVQDIIVAVLGHDQPS
jgi:hypothetical protein